MKNVYNEGFIKDIRELLEYNQESGKLYWKERPRKFFKTDLAHRLWNGKHSGKRAGRVVKRGRYEHRVVWIFDKPHVEHRIAWMLFYNETPPDQIDHINRVAKDNRICNLRASDAKANHRNKSMASNNTSGFVGVSWSKKSGKWQAYGKDVGNQVTLGFYDDLCEAARVAREFRDRAGYEKTHGELTKTV